MTSSIDDFSKWKEIVNTKTIETETSEFDPMSSNIVKRYKNCLLFYCNVRTPIEFS